MNNAMSATDGINSKKRTEMSIVAIILGIVGAVMIIQFVFIFITIIIGDLLITVNPDTGEKINGAGKIIPDIMREWQSILIFVLGIICLYISCKVLKGNNKEKTSRGRIVTMEEVKDTTYEGINSNFEEINKKQVKN